MHVDFFYKVLAEFGAAFVNTNCVADHPGGAYPLVSGGSKRDEVGGGALLAV